jgi:hypothetical protein
MPATRDRQVTMQAPVQDETGLQQRLVDQSEALASLFQSWRAIDEEEIAEQRDTLALLKKALNQEPLSDRPRFR